MVKKDLSIVVKNLCMKWKVSRYSRDKYDKSDEWIMRRLLEYADICRSIDTQRGLDVNAIHAYHLIHDLCDSNDRVKIRYLYNFYKTARKISIAGFSFS